MSRTTYAPRIKHDGLGNNDTYTFPFKIEAVTQLEIVEYDDSSPKVETQRVRGDDVTYLSSVVFNTTTGGTVVLAANLANNYTLIFLLANDSPTQDDLYKNKQAFTLSNIEASLDFVVGEVMRAMYLALLSVRMPDIYTSVDFNPTLPIEITDTTSQSIVTNAAGTGFEIGPTLSTINGAVASAAAAAASATAAATSESNAATSETNAAASAAAAAASAASFWSAYAAAVTLTAGTGPTALSGENWLSADYTTVWYDYEIIRGTTINANGRIALQKQNGSWIVNNASYLGNSHGVTFTLTGTTTQQLNVTVGAGSNGTIKLSKRFIA